MNGSPIYMLEWSKQFIVGAAQLLCYERAPLRLDSGSLQHSYNSIRKSENNFFGIGILKHLT